MKIIAIVLLLLLIAVAVRFVMLGQASKNATAPGLRDGALLPCPDKPNCVCSEYPSDTAHYIEPLPPGEPVGTALQRMQNAIIATGGVITIQTDRYLAATYTSTVFRFVDDVEVRLGEITDELHIRSASRTGHSDLGINRKRVEQLRAAFAAH